MLSMDNISALRMSRRSNIAKAIRNNSLLFRFNQVKSIHLGYHHNTAGCSSQPYYNDRRQLKSERIYAILAILTSKGEQTMEKYLCKLCGYIYDPETGDPSQDIAPGTAFADLPDDYVCPLCGADKGVFAPV